MNLPKLFEIQKVLDDRIMEEHPELKGQDNLDWKVLALQVELGECANEWRGFKKWSHDQAPRVRVNTCEHCIENNLDGCCGCNGELIVNRVLGEYVDCLHLVLSIGLEHGFDKSLSGLAIEPIEYTDITAQFSSLMVARWDGWIEGDGRYYHEGLEMFIRLGEMLGFTWDQIEQAYLEKNKENHERQNNGY